MQLTSLFSDYRPSNLPKKSAQEASRHHAEVAKMNRAYVSKLKREAKGKQLQREEESRRRGEEEARRVEAEKKNVEREQRLEEAANIWLKTIVPTWDRSDAGRIPRSS